MLATETVKWKLIGLRKRIDRHEGSEHEAQLTDLSVAQLHKSRCHNTNESTACEAVEDSEDHDTSKGLSKIDGEPDH